MPPRRKEPTESQKHELEAFAEKYDVQADIYGDPVVVVFRIMARAAARADIDGDELALRAADTLMGYRYPKVKAAEIANTVAPVLNFNVSMEAPRPVAVAGKQVLQLVPGAKRE